MPDARLYPPEVTLDGASLSTGAYAADLRADALKQLELDHGLRTAIHLSLFVHRVADPSADVRSAPDEPFPDRRGYWGDRLSPIPGDRWGSRLYQLAGQPLTDDRVSDARDIVAEALEWIETLGIGTVSVDARRREAPPTGILEIDFEIVDATTGEPRSFRILWDAMIREGV